MNRRTFLESCAGLTSTFLPERGIIDGFENKVTLTGILAPTALLPPKYEEVTQSEDLSHHSGGQDVIEERSQTGYDSGRLKRNDGETTQWAYAKRVFARGGNMDPPLGRVKMQASQVRGSEHTQGSLDDHHESLLDDHHESLLWRGFGNREPTLDYFTDWYDADIVEDTVNNYRRTRYWHRHPKVDYWPKSTYPVESERSYSEHTLIVQSTDWGALEVEVSQCDVDEKWQSRRLARRLMASMRCTTQRNSTPIPSPEL